MDNNQTTIKLPNLPETIHFGLHGIKLTVPRELTKNKDAWKYQGSNKLGIPTAIIPADVNPDAIITGLVMTSNNGDFTVGTPRTSQPSRYWKGDKKGEIIPNTGGNRTVTHAIGSFPLMDADTGTPVAYQVMNEVTYLRLITQDGDEIGADGKPVKVPVAHEVRIGLRVMRQGTNIAEFDVEGDFAQVWANLAAAIL